MINILFILLLLQSVPASITLTTDCLEPELENGEVAGEGDLSQWVGTFKCQAGFVLVGAKRSKCRDGVWSSNPPVCTAVGACDPLSLPKVKFARLMEQRGFRGSVYKYTCMKGYRMYGKAKVYCDGTTWNFSTAPVCAKSGCDEDQVSVLRYGYSRRLLDGAVYRFRCEKEAELLGPDLIFCNGTLWNESTPTCLMPASSPNLTITINTEEEEVDKVGEVGEGDLKTVLVKKGDTVSVQCKAVDGNPDPLILIYFDEQQVGFPREFRNTFSFTASADQHGMRVRCEARNSIMVAPAVSFMIIKVKYSASSLLISAPDFGLQGSLQTFTCTAGPSFPQTKLNWVYQQDFSESEVIIDNTYSEVDGGYYTSSKLQLRLPSSPLQSRSSNISCRSDEHGDLLENSTTIQIYEPPSSPELLVLVDGGPVDKVKVGQQFTIECKVFGGNPDPILRLLVDKQEVGLSQNRNIIHTMTVEERNSDCEIECSVWNSALESEDVSKTHLAILYPAIQPTLRLAEDGIKVNTVTAGNTIEINCGYIDDKDRGNPEACLSLSIDGLSLVENSSEDIVLIFQSERDHQGSNIECSAINEVMETAATSSTEVGYPPEDPTLLIYVGAEPVNVFNLGDEVTVKCGYMGNQEDQGYPHPTLKLIFNDEIILQNSSDDISWSFEVVPELMESVIDCVSMNSYLNVEKKVSTIINITLLESKEDYFEDNVIQAKGSVIDVTDDKITDSNDKTDNYDETDYYDETDSNGETDYNDKTDYYDKTDSKKEDLKNDDHEYIYELEGEIEASFVSDNHPVENEMENGEDEITSSDTFGEIVSDKSDSEEIDYLSQRLSGEKVEPKASDIEMKQVEIEINSLVAQAMNDDVSTTDTEKYLILPEDESLNFQKSEFSSELSASKEDEYVDEDDDNNQFTEENDNNYVYHDEILNAENDTEDSTSEEAAETDSGIVEVEEEISQQNNIKEVQTSNTIPVVSDQPKSSDNLIKKWNAESLVKSSGSALSTVLMPLLIVVIILNS